MMESPAASAAKVLSSKGQKLHTDGMDIRRSANKGYITKHNLTDKNGNPPSDGQKPTKEYTHANMKELLAHVEQHMAQPQDQDTDDEQPQQPQQPGA
jgi:hypothetical protein